jgi:hypothetical protein
MEMMRWDVTDPPTQSELTFAPEEWMTPDPVQFRKYHPTVDPQQVLLSLNRMVRTLENTIAAGPVCSCDDCHACRDGRTRKHTRP